MIHWFDSFDNLCQQTACIGHKVGNFFFILHSLATRDALGFGGDFSTRIGNFFLIFFSLIPLSILLVQYGIVTITFVFEPGPFARLCSQFQTPRTVF